MTVILDKTWLNLSIPEWLTLMQSESMTIENSMLKLTGNNGLTNRPRVYVNSNILPLEYYVKAEFMIPEQTYNSYLHFQIPLNEFDHKSCPIWIFGDSVYIEYHNMETGELLHRVDNAFLIIPDVPFTVITHVKRAEVNGLIDIWFDESKVFSYTGQTLWDATQLNCPILVDCYGDDSGSTYTVYQKNVIIATTLEEVLEKTKPVIPIDLLAAAILYLMLA